MQRNDVFTKIAQQHLGIETLETRSRDRLDFHDVSVWSVKAALEAAYAAGQLATDKIRQKRIANGGSYLAAFEAKYQDIVDFFWRAERRRPIQNRSRMAGIDAERPNPQNLQLQNQQVLQQKLPRY